jgi:hypothetical protein
MKRNTFIVLLAAVLISSCDLTTLCVQTPTILTIRAYIDGRSQLIIEGNTIYWHHLDFEAPGRWELGETIQPTYINHMKWYPTWPDVPDATNDFCDCYSSVYMDIPNLAGINQRVWLDIVQGRGRIFVIQQPDIKNNYTMIVEFDDNNFDGAEWYELNLNYIVGAPD